LFAEPTHLGLVGLLLGRRLPTRFPGSADATRGSCRRRHRGPHEKDLVHGPTGDGVWARIESTDSKPARLMLRRSASAAWIHCGRQARVCLFALLAFMTEEQVA
jgi:hypothetical protein